MCPVPYWGKTGEDLEKIIIIILKGLYNSLLWTGPCVGRQPFRVLNVTTTCSCWKCGGSRYDLVMSVLYLILGYFSCGGVGKTMIKLFSLKKKRVNENPLLFGCLGVKCDQALVSVVCFDWNFLGGSLNFLSYLTQLSQFGCEDGSVCQKWHILRVVPLAAIPHQTVWLMGSLLLFRLKTTTTTKDP